MKSFRTRKSPKMFERSFLTTKGKGRRRKLGIHKILQLTDFGIPMGYTKIVIPKGISPEYRNIARNTCRQSLQVQRLSVNFLRETVDFLLLLQGETVYETILIAIKRRLLEYARYIKRDYPGLSSQMYSLSRVLNLRGSELVRKASRWRLDPPQH